MADLLECVLQIKGLRESAARVEALASGVDEGRWSRRPSGGGPSAADLLAQMVEIETVHGAWLRLMLASSKPSLPAPEDRRLLDSARHGGGDMGRAVESFLARRRQNVDLLDACSADDLARTAVHPARREISVADLVAVMLAGDIERLGEIRRALQSG